MILSDAIDGCKSKKFQEIEDAESGKKKLKSATLQSGVNRAQIEDLIEL
jgi:hypothetical protein